MVSCLSQLSTVLSNSLSMNTNILFPGVPEPASRHTKTSPPAFYAAGSSAQPAHTASQVNHVPCDTGHPNSLGDQHSTFQATQTGPQGYPSGQTLTSTQHAELESGTTANTSASTENSGGISGSTSGLATQTFYKNGAPTASGDDAQDIAKDLRAPSAYPSGTSN